MEGAEGRPRIVASQGHQRQAPSPEFSVLRLPFPPAHQPACWSAAGSALPDHPLAPCKGPSWSGSLVT